MYMGIFQAASKKYIKHIVGCVLDTTNTNSGWRAGIIVRLEAYLDRWIIHIYCRHHDFPLMPQRSSILYDCLPNKMEMSDSLVVLIKGVISLP